MEEVLNQLEQIGSKERLQGLEATGGYVFHGSPFIVKAFEPKQAFTDIDGESTPDGEPSVFASAEIEIPIFRSVFHEHSLDGLEGSYEIGFSNSDDNKRYIHASKAAVEVCKKNFGYVYVFKRDDFALRGNREWVATTEVKPVAVFHSNVEDVGLPIYPSKPEGEGDIC